MHSMLLGQRDLEGSSDTVDDISLVLEVESW